jgi:DNA-binding NarL/FixJ family response regulator
MTSERQVIRIIIADERPHFRQGLRRLLESDAGLCVVGEASDASRTASLVREIKPDILLVDLDLSSELKIETLNDLGASSPIRIVTMVATDQKADILRAFMLGVHGIVLKASVPRVLLNSIHSVMAGQYSLEHESLGILVEALRAVRSDGNGASSPKNYGLTRRELDIITKIASGRSNKEVGEEFSISERTVKHHLTNIFTKVGVTSRLQLALFAVNHNLSSPPTASELHPIQSDDIE